MTPAKSTPESVARSTRLLNLVAALLATNKFITAEQIRTSIYGYEPHDSEENFARKFERDKEYLRQLGIPIEVGDPFDGTSDYGYRINRSDYEIGEISLSNEEITAVTLAATLWKSPEQQKHTRRAVRKLKGAGIDFGDLEDNELDYRRDALLLSNSTIQTALSHILRAIHEKRVITFLYRNSGSTAAHIRTVEPWTVAIQSRNVYFMGFDVAKQASRTFKLTRVVDEITITDTKFSHPIPTGVSSQTLSPVNDATQVVKVWVETGTSAGLTRAWHKDGSVKNITPAVHHGKEGEVWTLHNVPEDELIRATLARGNHAIILAPEHLVSQAVTLLEDLRTSLQPRASHG